MLATTTYCIGNGSFQVTACLTNSQKHTQQLFSHVHEERRRFIHPEKGHSLSRPVFLLVSPQFVRSIYSVQSFRLVLCSEKKLHASSQSN